MFIICCLIMSQSAEEYQDSLVFKGLQRPLEFLGFQGRYIVWAACTVGVGILAFIIAYVALGFIVALAVLTAIFAVGGVSIFLKQRKGLHSKSEEKGIYIFAHSRRI